MLEEIYKSYRAVADNIKWQDYNCNDLFYEYIKHEHDNMSEIFYAAIVCRYWGYAGRLYTQCNKHVPFEQCYDTIIDVINYVLEKRVWENPKSSLYQDHKAADKAFHMVYKRQRGVLLANLNAYKRRSNFNTLSIDKVREDYKDSTDGFLFEIEDPSTSKTISFIKSISDKSDPIKTLVLDQICFGDSFRAGQVNINMIINNIFSLSEDDLKHISLLYDLDIIELISKLQKVNSKELEKEIKIMLYNMRREITEIDK